ncbi:TetR family transcriptional regulator [Clostridia bacterium]|nr:TetR family transcriptional regulator [Clostridia bacterium]
MKTTKTDHRSRYTQMTVREGLLKLLLLKPLNKIGVAEVCAVAGINRGTFYNHFYDVFDVYESIESGFYEAVKDKLEGMKIYEFDKLFYKEILLVIYKNTDLVRVILKSLPGNEFLKRIIVFVKDKFVKEWSENRKDIPLPMLEQVFSYSANGAIGLISDWVISGMTRPLDELSDLIGKLNGAVLAVMTR